MTTGEEIRECGLEEVILWKDCHRNACTLQLLIGFVHYDVHVCVRVPMHVCLNTLFHTGCI